MNKKESILKDESKGGGENRDHGIWHREITDGLFVGYGLIPGW